MTLAFNDFMAQPGPLAARETTENAFMWGDQRLAVLSGSITVDGAARDAGNSPTNELRAGLAMGQVASGGKYKQWDPAAVDGTENLVGFLTVPVKMIDLDGNNADRQNALLLRGMVQALKVYTSATPYGVTNKLRLAAVGRFLFDDDAVELFKASLTRLIQNPTANAVTLTAADNGKTFIATGTGAQTYTLPSIATVGAGWSATIFNSVDQNLTVTRAGSDTLVTFNNAAAASVAFSTSGEKIGAGVRILCDGTKFYVSLLGKNTLTVA